MYFLITDGEFVDLQGFIGGFGNTVKGKYSQYEFDSKKKLDKKIKDDKLKKKVKTLKISESDNNIKTKLK